jgi:hypothetical protein
MANDPCGGVRSCCDTLCVPDSQGVGFCVSVGGCKVMGEICTTNLDCCSEYDLSGNPIAGAIACAAGPDGILRCQKTTSCLQNGEICGGQGASSNCCAANGSDKHCYNTSAGVQRCSVQGACIPSGSAQECATPDQCCSHVCVLVAGVGYRCQSACLPESGQSCAAMTCGAGLSCVNGRCTNNPPCSADADCCNGDLCQRGNCVPSGQTCVANGGACTSSAQCCYGGCFGGYCQALI